MFNNNPSFSKVMDFYQDFMFVLVVIFGLFLVAKIYSVISNKLYDIEHPNEANEDEPEKEQDLPTRALIKIKKIYTHTRTLTFLLGVTFLVQGYQIANYKWMPFYEINKQSGGFESKFATFTGIALILYAIVMKRKNT